MSTADEGPLVSFLVVTLRAQPSLQDSLDAIRATIEHAAVPAEVIVVANGRHARNALPRSRTDGVTVVPSIVNRGFAGGLALARAESSGAFLAIVQDDSMLKRNWLSELLRAMDSDPMLGAVAGLTESLDGEVYRRGWIIDRRRVRDVERRHAVQGDVDGLVNRVELVSSNAMLVRAVAWDGTGGPDPRLFPLSHVDFDLCMRLLSGGWCVGIVPSTGSRHAQSASLGGYRRRYANAHNGRVFRHRWRAQLRTVPRPPRGRPPTAAELEGIIETGLSRASHVPHPFASVTRRPVPPGLRSAMRAEFEAGLRVLRFRAGAQFYRVVRPARLGLGRMARTFSKRLVRS